MLCSPRALLAAALTLPLLPFAALRAEDWPQWRGLNRDGVCGETGLLESFPAEGWQVRWRVPVGSGWSNPVVAQGRVYLSSGELICLEASTGKQVWESDKVTDLKNGASIHLTPNGDPYCSPRT
jgi:outer membrane protein assembly factor BamB